MISANVNPTHQNKIKRKDYWTQRTSTKMTRQEGTQKSTLINENAQYTTEFIPYFKW